MNCWRCGTAIEVSERVGFRDCCPKCDRALHACRNCGFYDPGYHNQCRETMAELVADKERANFCEYFTPAAAASRREASSGGRAVKPPPAAPAGRSAGNARDKLEELFKRK